MEATTIGHPDPVPPVPSLTVLSFNDSGDNLQIHFSEAKNEVFCNRYLIKLEMDTVYWVLHSEIKNAHCTQYSNRVHDCKQIQSAFWIS